MKRMKQKKRMEKNDSDEPCTTFSSASHHIGCCAFQTPDCKSSKEIFLLQFQFIVHVMFDKPFFISFRSLSVGNSSSSSFSVFFLLILSRDLVTWCSKVYIGYVATILSARVFSSIDVTYSLFIQIPNCPPRCDSINGENRESFVWMYFFLFDESFFFLFSSIWNDIIIYAISFRW